MTLDDLGALYCLADDATMAACVAEATRRDRADDARRAREARHAEWYDTAFAQYLEAEQTCRGNLLSRAGEAAGITEPFSLWRGTEAWAMRMASEELRNLWLEHGRLTVTGYRAQITTARRADRDTRDLAAIDAAVIPSPPVVIPPAPVITQAMSLGAIARFEAALSNYGSTTSALAEAIAARAARITAGTVAA